MSSDRESSDSDVVISGLSGRLPQADTIEEFADQLFAGVDLVTADDCRWTPGFLGLPLRNGKLKNLSHFDATFFGVHASQADQMDPQLRKLLEVSYEAVVDAGLSPSELRGSSTGVYVGASASESEELWTADPDRINGYVVTGCDRAMFANRISYSFDLKGPSCSINTACSSSLSALVEAAQAMHAGRCDAALVAGTNLVLKPNNSLAFHRLNMLSPNGRCAAFDESACGYVKSEAVVAILIQRRAAARRVYATVRGAGVNTDGYKTQGITHPSADMQLRLVEDTLRRAGLRPEQVAYVEAHGTGTQVGDSQELKAVAELFCKDRREPLLIGSVKSNMGHAEVASGLCSVAKVLLAMERGVIPANLHFQRPNSNIAALVDGRLKVVTKNTPWNGGLVAVNSFGFGGANAHVILESERGGRGAAGTVVGAGGVPRLVVSSGRTEPAARELLALAAAHPRDAGLHALLDAVHAHNVSGHAHRGYRLLTSDERQNDNAQALEELFELGSNERRPIWFVFSGLGSQRAGVGKALMRIPTFASSINKSAEVLKQLDVDLHYILSEAPESEFNDMTTSFVCIAAVQLALVDVLRSVEVHPDGVVGHSLGEMGCAYADGSLSAENAILAAYWRARSVKEAEVSPGAMAAVGLSWEECARRCPPDLDLACHNCHDNVTISGPTKSIDKFVEQLSSEKIFAKRVDSAGVAFHSRYISAAGPLLRRNLQRLITRPRPRSPRWISSSLLREEWNSEIATVCDAEYLVNNLLCPVRFAEAMAEVPENALVIEIGPRSLLQAVLRRARVDAAHVSLGARGAADACMHLLRALGRLHGAGAQPRFSTLYPPAVWPVPRGTPSLASSVLWDHSVEYRVPKYESSRCRGEVVQYDLSNPDDSFIADHNIDGRILFPATGYLVLVWRNMAQLHNRTLENTPIIFENVQFKRPTVMPDRGPVHFYIDILKNTGDFEISENNIVVVTGRVRLTGDTRQDSLNLVYSEPDTAGPLLQKDDIYTEFRVRGYHYSGAFCGITDCNFEATSGTLAWNDNWICFMDTMLQLRMLGIDTKQLLVPTRLRHALVDPAAHLRAVAATGGALTVFVHREIDAVRSAGIEFRGLRAHPVSRQLRTEMQPILENFSFHPYDIASSFPDQTISIGDVLAVNVQLVLENTQTLDVKIIEMVFGRSSDEPLAVQVAPVLQNISRHRFDVSVVVEDNDQYAHLLSSENIKVLSRKIHTDTCPDGYHLVLATNIVCQNDAENCLKLLILASADSGMILLRESITTLDNKNIRDIMFERAELVIVSRQKTTDHEFLLLRRRPVLPKDAVVIQIKDDTYDWLEALQDALKRSETGNRRVYAVARSPYSGILGLGTSLKWESIGRSLRVYFLPNAENPFLLDSPTYSDQVRKDLVVNVLQEGIWGSYRHLIISEDDQSTLRAEHSYVKIQTVGDLSSLRWVQNDMLLATCQDASRAGSVCEVHYASLNFHDVMLATSKLTEDSMLAGLLEQECPLGIEFSGRSARGTRVMGIVSSRGLATTALADPGFLWEVPAEWSLEEAATVPVAYATAYYALSVRGRMRRGESVLVHAGSGGVGQAAIAIALHAGCTVYTTVGTPDKRAFLRERFPALPAENVGNSRDTSFEQLVMHRTGGRGVDLVLNSLAGAQLLASVRCLAHGGRFLEIGRFDFSNDTSLGMSLFLKNTTFHGIILKALIGENVKDENKDSIVRCMGKGIAEGAVRPLPRTVFGDHRLEQAFRYMATGKHIGKVLVRVRGEGGCEGGAAPTVALQPRVRPDRTYVLVGGLGGVGMELAFWLVSRGARDLLLNSRRGIRTGYQSWCLNRLRANGVRVRVCAADCGSESAARELLRTAAETAPVAGVFNLAALLRDAAFEKQTAEHFETVSRPKIDVTRALDAASRQLAPELEYFVVFSSMASGRGNYGQANYAYANSAAERIVEARRRAGLPALAVQWGAIGDVGIARDSPGGGGATIAGTAPQTVDSCLRSLGALLVRPQPVTASWVLPFRQGRTPRGTGDLSRALANILGIKQLDRVSKSSTFAELGMDSLMGAEIKRTLEREHSLILEVQEIFALTFAKLDSISPGGARSAVPRASAEYATAAGELVPKQVVVKLPSAAPADSDSSPVFMVHPIEGVVDLLRGVAASVRAPVMGLQCAASAPLGDMAALARFYVSHVRALQPRPPYTLLGYSYGAAVAFEMALQLEQAGCECRLVLLDGSPKFIDEKIQRDKLSPRLDDSGLIKALAYFALSMTSIDVTELSNDLRKLSGREERVIFTARRLSEVTPYSVGDLETAAMRFYERIALAAKYKPRGRVRSPVTLFSACDNYVALSEDYGLGEVCCGPLVTRRLPGNHRTILAGDSARTVADHLSLLLHTKSSHEAEIFINNNINIKNISSIAKNT